MTIESATYLNSLNTAYPATGDQMGEGDDQIRLLKTVLKNTFPGRAGVEGRAIVKSAGFTPATTENGALFVGTAEITCTLPALAGVAEGTHYEFKPLTHAMTISAAGGESIDLASSYVIATGDWAVVAKVDGTRWAIMRSTTLSAASITAALGVTYVQNANYATNAGRAAPKNSGGANFDLVLGEIINPYYIIGTGDTGTTLKLVPRGHLSVAYADSAGSTGYAGSAGNADTLDGYHYNNLPYVPIAVGNNVGSIIGFCIVDEASGYTEGSSYAGSSFGRPGTWLCLTCALYDGEGESFKLVLMRRTS